jgi:chorismate mutase
LATIDIKRTDVFGPETVLEEQGGMKAASRYWVDLSASHSMRVPVLVTLANQIALRSEAVTNATLWKEILIGYFQQRMGRGWKPDPAQPVTLTDAEVLALYRERKHLAEQAAGGVHFEQAGIPIVDAEKFGRLHAAVSKALDPQSAERFLKSVKSAGLRIRHFESALKDGLLDAAGGFQKGEGWNLFAALPVSDQAQVREHYLTEIEKVELRLRKKYQRVYEYA